MSKKEIKEKTNRWVAKTYNYYNYVTRINNDDNILTKGVIDIGADFSVYGVTINDFVDPFWAQFSPIVYEDNSFLGSFSIDDNALWLSDNPLGAIIHIEIPADEGTVICTDYSDLNWTFTTIEVPYEDEHPVSGNRDFGYEINSDGSYTFYTRGVDRMTDAYDYIIEIVEDIIEDTSGIPTDFDLFSMTTDPLWESFQNKISEFVNNPTNSGVATILEPIKNRPDWVLVKEVFNGERPISDLGCE